jgi:hypothetical protein
MLATVRRQQWRICIQSLCCGLAVVCSCLLFVWLSSVLLHCSHVCRIVCAHCVTYARCRMYPCSLNMLIYLSVAYHICRSAVLAKTQANALVAKLLRKEVEGNSPGKPSAFLHNCIINARHRIDEVRHGGSPCK